MRSPDWDGGRATPLRRNKSHHGTARAAVELPPWIAPSLRTAFGTRELEAFELAKDTADGCVRRSETDRAKPVSDSDRRPAKRAREGAERLLNHKFGVHLDEPATRSRIFGRVVHADDDGVPALAERPKRCE